MYVCSQGAEDHSLLSDHKTDHKTMLFILVLSVDLCLLCYPISLGLPQLSRRPLQCKQMVRYSLGWCKPINCLFI